MPIPFLLAIDRVEMLGEGGNTLISSHTATQLMWPFRHLPQVALDMLSGPMGFYSDSSSTSGSYPSSVVQMTPDEEQTFYVPLIENPLALNHIFCGALKSDCYLRVWMRVEAPSLSTAARFRPSKALTLF